MQIWHHAGIAILQGMHLKKYTCILMEGIFLREYLRGLPYKSQQKTCIALEGIKQFKNGNPLFNPPPPPPPNIIGNVQT